MNNNKTNRAVRNILQGIGLKTMKRVFIVVFAGLLIHNAASENIRGPIVKIIPISSDIPSVSTGNVSTEDLIALVPGNNIYFLRGVDIRLTVPNSLISHINNFSFNIFQDVIPEPNEDTVQYRAEQIFSHPLANRKISYFHLPLTDNKKIKNQFDTITIKSKTTHNNFPFILTIHPLMKGIPFSMTSAQFQFTFQPITANKGGIKFTFVDKNNQTVKIQPSELTLCIDKQIITDFDSNHILNPGMHTVELTSKKYKSKTFNIGVEKGTTKQVSILLEKPVSFLNFNAPKETDIYFDGNEVNWSPDTQIAVTPGEHMVVFVLGEYKTSKKITIMQNKAYNISLFLDILVNER